MKVVYCTMKKKTKQRNMMTNVSSLLRTMKADTNQCSLTSTGKDSDRGNNEMQKEIKKQYCTHT